MTDIRRQISEALRAFSELPTAEAATSLLETLGYRSEKKFHLQPNTVKNFTAAFDPFNKLPAKSALRAEAKTVDFLFQVADDEIRASGGQNELPFDSKGKWNDTAIESYIFLALTLKGGTYTRSRLSAITREVNRLFPMPAMLLFRHGDTLTLSIIRRRPHKRDSARDVLEKVTLIKDIRFADPHRAHIEILHDLSFPKISGVTPPKNFAELHEAWQKALNIQALNRRFFVEIRNWFYWARLHAGFPKDAVKDADGRDSESLIRLLTRMIFCWFLREKELLPDTLFDPVQVESLLRDWRAADCENDESGRYYKAILQNLFFATLSTPVSERKFRTPNKGYRGYRKDYGDQRFFRHVALFVEKAPVEDLYKSIPFLNGGLFENLDEVPGRDPDVESEVRVDGFSEIVSKQPRVPDFLFFGNERQAPELAELLDERSAPRVRGLLNIFQDYKFTVEENTPIEEDIALDPELLGRAFENLLASVNPETGTVARKATGSFYTPREIVHYMAEESLVRYLLTILQKPGSPAEEVESRIRELISDQSPEHRLSDSESDEVVRALGSLRILDPACGSGAFPMGLLQLLVHVLRKLDPRNRRWKKAKLEALPPEMREKAEQVFEQESFDYTRKLEIIKDCIHGVDIQPSAIQISKLRFFLSLVIEQSDPGKMLPLPNLETKFVCANTLLKLAKPEGWELFYHQIAHKERELLKTRSRYFFAGTKAEKDECRTADRKLRKEIGGFIKGFGGSIAEQLSSAVADWDPYRSERRADYFDPESMFGVKDGFDIVIGNPPYVQLQKDGGKLANMYKNCGYTTFARTGDIYALFYENGISILSKRGILCFISSNKWMRAGYGKPLRNFFLTQNPQLLIDLGPGVFESATVDTNILLISKGAGPTNIAALTLQKEGEDKIDIRDQVRRNAVRLTNLTGDAWFVGSDAEQKLKEKIQQIGKPLGQWDVNIYFGIKTGLNEAFIIDTPTKERLCAEDPKSAQILKSILRGRDIKRYECRWAGLWLIASGFDIDVPEKYPAIYRHLLKFKQKASKRDDQGRNWWNLRACAYYEEFEKEKVVWKRIGSVLRFAYDPSGLFCQDSTCIMTGKHLKYLVALMNSKIGYKQLFDLAPKTGTGDVIVSVQALEPLSVPPITSANRSIANQIEKLVDQILSAKKAGSDTSKLESEIDQLVYRLYNLTPEEIAIVEGKR